MADGDRRKVSVAYVTKWAATRGIVVVKGAEGWTTDGGKEYLTGRSIGSSLFVGPAQWTEDKDVAEKRWYAAVKKARDAAKQKVKALEVNLAKAAPYTEES